MLYWFKCVKTHTSYMNYFKTKTNCAANNGAKNHMIWYIYIYIYTSAALSIQQKNKSYKFNFGTPSFHANQNKKNLCKISLQSDHI